MKVNKAISLMLVILSMLFLSACSNGNEQVSGASSSSEASATGSSSSEIASIEVSEASSSESVPTESSEAENARTTFDLPENPIDEAKIISIADRLMREGMPAFFWYNSDGDGLELATDSDNGKIEVDGQEFVKVGNYATMAELKAATEALFTDEFCEQQLYDKVEIYQKFTEIDGALYYNISVGGMGWPYDLPKEYTVDSAHNDEIILRAVCDGMDTVNRTDATIEYEFKVILRQDDGAWKLNSFYDFASEDIEIKIVPRQ